MPSIGAPNGVLLSYEIMIIDLDLDVGVCGGGGRGMVWDLRFAKMLVCLP